MIKIVVAIFLFSMVIAGVIFMCLRAAERVRREGGGNWRVIFGLSHVASGLMIIFFLYLALQEASLYVNGSIPNLIPSLVGVIGLFFWVVAMYFVHYRYMITEGRIY